MAKVINRDVPIAEENTTPYRPARQQICNDDWSEEMEDRADNVYDDTKKKSPETKRQKRRSSRR